MSRCKLEWPWFISPENRAKLNQRVSANRQVDNTTEKSVKRMRFTEWSQSREWRKPGGSR
jgi:hypothetical protein